MQSPFKDLPREVSILVAASFFVAVGFGIVLPAIPVFAKSFGVNNAAIGLMVSAFAITRFASGLISGTLVDKFGERAVFSSGVFMVALFTFLAGLAQSYEQLLFFRAAGGLGSSMFSVAAGSVIMRSVDDANRGRAQSVYQGSFLLGGIAGPAIGGLLSVISLRAPFFVYSGMLICSGTVAHFFLKGDKIGKVDKSVDTSDHTTVREALAMKPYRIALVLTFIGTWVFFGLRASILPIFVTEELDSTTAVVGYGLALSAVIQGLVLLRAGRYSDEKGRRAASIIGAQVVLFGVLLLTFSIHIWMYLISMAVLGFGGAFLSTTPASIVGDVIKGKGGKVIAIFQMAGDAGMMVGPIIIGAVSDFFSYRTAFGMSAAIFVIALILVYQIPETRNVEGPQVKNLRPLDEDL
ncbi:MAG: MFS transporter [Actinobacteria bacterium]|jgi:MFS family permease|nr:MFS transporter [Actinomycetota bacterium]NCV82683.1 MFS transporter [Actinomycetota bacterium]NCW42981.1 MFS transporter [Actinomycetota bacterium]NCX16944.1 MFS transporter [Actinomycetota bacterium]NCX38242.1 MFS transporter [Actinomycetota bacterium]